MNYERHELLALGAEKTATALIRDQLETIRGDLFHSVPFGGEEMHHLRNRIDEAVQVAQDAAQAAALRYQAAEGSETR